MEGVRQGTNVNRYLFLGTEPYRVIVTGPNEEQNGDPLVHLQNEIQKTKVIQSEELPTEIRFKDCGAVGYVSYDCVRYFEPRVEEFIAKQKNVLELPESTWMFFNSMIVIDKDSKDLFIIALCRLDVKVEENYNLAVKRIEQLENRIRSNAQVPEAIDSADKPVNIASLSLPLRPLRSEYSERGEAVSNVGESGYKNMVATLKKHINNGDIIQAVPSQRLTV